MKNQLEKKKRKMREIIEWKRGNRKRWAEGEEDSGERKMRETGKIIIK